MTARLFLRMVLWGLLVLEGLTALAVAILPVDPGNLALKGSIVRDCAYAAVIAGACLLAMAGIDDGANG